MGSPPGTTRPWAAAARQMCPVDWRERGGRSGGVLRDGVGSTLGILTRGLQLTGPWYTQVAGAHLPAGRSTRARTSVVRRRAALWALPHLCTLRTAHELGFWVFFLLAGHPLE